MIIKDRVSNQIPQPGAEAVKLSVPPKVNTERKGQEQDDAFEVRLTSAAAQESEDQARLERLSKIRQQLAEGTYSISGKDVADKMLKVLKS